MVKSDSNKIGLLTGIAYTTCTIIGSGIFVSPKGILLHAGSIGLSLIVWILCALISMITALAYIELGTSIPECGSDFSYIQYVGWSPLAFSFLWLASLIEGTGACAVVFLTFGKYLSQALNPLHMDLDDEQKKLLQQLLGFAIVMLLSWLNFFSIARWASRLQVVFMTLKVLTCSLLIVTGLYFIIFKGNSSSFTDGKLFANSSWNAGQLSLAIYSGRWAYTGWDCLSSATEDIHHEELAWVLPRAMLGGLSLASVIYVLCNVAYFAILTPTQILNSDAVATSFCELTLGNFQYAMPAIVGFLMIGTLNSDIFQWSRFTIAGARKGFMPTVLSLTDPYSDSPRISVIFHMLVAMGFSFFDLDTLLDYVTVAGMLRQVVAIASLLYIKWTKMPVADTAIKYHWSISLTALLISVALIVIPFYQDILEAGVSCALVLISTVLYFCFVWPNYRLPILRKLNDITTVFCQRIFLCAVDEEPEYRKQT